MLKMMVQLCNRSINLNHIPRLRRRSTGQRISLTRKRLRFLFQLARYCRRLRRFGHRRRPRFAANPPTQRSALTRSRERSPLTQMSRRLSIRRIAQGNNGEAKEERAVREGEGGGNASVDVWRIGCDDSWSIGTQYTTSFVNGFDFLRRCSFPLDSFPAEAVALTDEGGGTGGGRRRGGGSRGARLDIELGRHRRRRSTRLWSGFDVAERSGKVDFEIGVDDTDAVGVRLGFHDEKTKGDAVMSDLDLVAFAHGGVVAESLLESAHPCQ